MPRTSFTELVGCDVPIQQAPMGAIGTPQLIGAATGAMGMVALPGAPAAVVVDLLEAVKAQAAGPFGFNVLLPFLDLEVVEVAAEHCRFVDFYHGPVDATLVERVHASGALAGWQVCAVDQARAAVGAGCDLIVVRGIEGGGRMYGSRGLWPLLAEVLEHVEVPVLAAGGIADGCGLAEALAAGAAGVRMGTRFIATPESGAHQVYKEALVSESATLLTDAFRVGWPDEQADSRVLRSAFVRAAGFAEGDVVARVTIGPATQEAPRFAVVPPIATATGEISAMAMYAGESVGLITSIEPAADIVRRVAREADELRGVTPA